MAKALDFVRQIRKTPIVVNERAFFYANRCIIPYINEGIRMVAEGVEPALSRMPPSWCACRSGPCSWWTKPRSTLRQDRQGHQGRHGGGLPR